MELKRVCSQPRKYVQVNEDLRQKLLKTQDKLFPLNFVQKDLIKLHKKQWIQIKEKNKNLNKEKNLSFGFIKDKAYFYATSCSRQKRTKSNFKNILKKNLINKKTNIYSVRKLNQNIFTNKNQKVLLKENTSLISLKTREKTNISMQSKYSVFQKKEKKNNKKGFNTRFLKTEGIENKYLSMDKDYSPRIFFRNTGMYLDRLIKINNPVEKISFKNTRSSINLMKKSKPKEISYRSALAPLK